VKIKSNVNYREVSVTFKNGEVSEGLIHYYKSDFHKVIFVNKSGKKFTYKPKDIKSFFNSFETFVAGKTPKNRFLFFKRVTKGGQMHLYLTNLSDASTKFQSPNSFDSDPFNDAVTTYYVYQESDEFFTPIKDLTRIRQKMSEYFSKCASLRERILANKFNKFRPEDDDKFSQIIRLYNSCEFFKKP